MSDVQQIRDDLSYVRGAVARRERSDGGAPAIIYVWAVYVIVGYTLMDFRIQYAGPFFAIGGFVGGIVSWYLGRRHSQKVGEWDRSAYMKAIFHFGGGIMLALMFTVGLATFIPELRDTRGSQVFVVMIGLTYYLWGVHYQRYFVVLGIIVMAGGVCVGQIAHFGWTILGLVISLGLVLPPLLMPRVRGESEPAASTTTGGQA